MGRVTVAAVWLVAVMSVASCGSKKSIETAAEECKAIAEGAIPDREPLTVDEVDALRSTLAKQCREWSAEARGCFVKSKTDRDRERCTRKLTQAQRDALDQEPTVEEETKHDDGREPPPLAVTSIEPGSGKVEGGMYVVVKGERFLKDGPRAAKVYFGSRQGTVIRFQSDRELIVQAPGGKPEEQVDVLLLFDPGGQFKLPNAFTFKEMQP